VGVDVGGPAGVDVDVWSEPGVDVGGPAGVDVDVWSEPGVEVGGPAGVDVGAWPESGGTEEGFPFVGEPFESLSAEPLVPVFWDVPFPGVTPAQNAATPSLPAAFSMFRKATLFVLGCPLLAMNALHSPNLAAPVASGPTAFELLAVCVPVLPVLSALDDSPTSARAPWTADCAGAGRFPVAAAAPVAVRASAGMAMPRAFIPNRLEIMRVPSGFTEAAAGVTSAAAMVETSASRRTSSSTVAGALAA
jgi:hypothetical protein